MAETFFKGEVGRVIGQTTGFDWTSQTAKQVKIKKPSGTVLTYTGSNVVIDDAVTGQIHVLSASGDLSETGEYLFQAKLTTAAGVNYGPLTSFFVEDVLS